MEIDELALRGLIEQSQDTHADGVRAAIRSENLVDRGTGPCRQHPGSRREPRLRPREPTRLGTTARRAGGLLAGAGGRRACFAHYIGGTAFA